MRNASSNVPRIPTRRETLEALISALGSLYSEDLTLMKRHAHERSITHWLASHLQTRADKWERGRRWKVDCEFNRQDGGLDRKALPIDCVKNVILPDDEDNSSVYPDIILHVRGPGPNLLVIEAKRDEGGAEDCDVLKLQAFTSRMSSPYRYGVFLRLGEEGCTDAKWYAAGQESPPFTKELVERLDHLGLWKGEPREGAGQRGAQSAARG